MNEELQQALLNIINNATAFVGEQAPAVVQELLAWKLWQNAVWFPLSLLIAWLAYRGVRYTYAVSRRDSQGESWAKEHGSLSGLGFTAMLLGSLGFLFFTINAIDNAQSVAKIMIAPKVFLIEYAASLTKEKD